MKEIVMKEQMIEQKSEKKEYAKPRLVNHGSAQAKTQTAVISPSNLGPPTKQAF
jgi:hypothetical protein